MSHVVREAYARLADQYIDLFGSVEQVDPGDLALIRRYLAGAAGPVLDLGCGPGHLTAFLHGSGVDVTGIDLVAQFIAHARATHPGVRFEQGSMTHLDRAAGSVAGALAWFSLIHVDPVQVDGVLATIRRLMAPGAAFVVGFFDGAAVEPFAHKVVTAYRFPAAEMAGRLARAGFVEVERRHRPRAGERRPYAVIAARAA